jgi:hypothetical protein
MKRLLILTAMIVLTTTAIACNCCNGLCRRGAPVQPCGPECAAPCGACGPCTTCPTVSPGPEAYTPVPQ